MAAKLGVRFKVTMPEFFLPYLDILDSQSVSQAITESLRAAGRPAATILKQIIRADVVNSDQSTGATERAVAIKYGKSKKRKSSYYVVVGISKSHFEYHTSKVPEGQITKLRRGRKQRGAGLFGLQTRVNKKKQLRSKQVFSRFRNERKIRASKGKPFKRFPRKYFHLIDLGFIHRHAGIVLGYYFLNKLRDSVADSIQKIFEEKLKQIILPVIKREIARKIKRVFR